MRQFQYLSILEPKHGAASNRSPDFPTSNFTGCWRGGKSANFSTQSPPCSSRVANRIYRQSCASLNVTPRSLETLRNYCALEETFMDICSPRNQLSMHSSSCWEFEEFRLCIRQRQVTSSSCYTCLWLFAHEVTQNPRECEVIRYNSVVARCSQ